MDIFLFLCYNDMRHIDSGGDNSLAIEIFNRYENKYLIDNKTFIEITKILEEHMVPDKYNPIHQDPVTNQITYDYYTISNIYYDTNDDYLIRKSISHPVYKEKLRLRGYGVPNIDDIVFLEIKKKFKKIVNKRRTKILLSDAYSMISDPEHTPKYTSYTNNQVLNEINCFLQKYELIPKVYIAYDRLAFFAKNDNDLRISFDKNIRTRHDNLLLEYGDSGELLIPPEQRLMEIKVHGAIPLWLSGILSDFSVYKNSFSKYGTEYIRKNARTNDNITSLEYAFPPLMKHFEKEKIYY